MPFAAKKPSMISEHAIPHAVLKVVLIYAAFAALWILFSDAAVIFVFSDPVQIATASTVKGWLFVVVTATLLFVLMKRFVADIAAKEALLRSLVHSIPDLVWLKDPEGEYLACNSSLERLFGAGEGEIIGRTDHDFVPKDLADYFRQKDREAMAVGGPCRNEEWVTFAADGHRALLETINTPMFDAHGRLVGVLGIGRDITRIREAQGALSESEQRYRSLFENMLEGLAYCKMLYDDQNRPTDFVYLEVNDAFERLTGLKDVVGKRVTEVIPGIREVSPELFECYGRVALTGEPERFEFDFKSFSQWLSVSVYSPNTGYFVAVFDNITERKRALKALIAAETKFRNLLESVQLVAVMLDCDGSISFCNNYFLGLTGWSRDEVLGRNFFDLFIPEEVRDTVKTAYGAYVSSKTLLNYQGTIVTRDGAKRLVVWNNSFLWDFDGNIIGVATIGTDVTEKQHLEEKLQQSQKMEAIGTLAGGIAHDFNNILTVIMGYAYLIMESDVDKHLKHMTDEIISSAVRAEEMTKSLLAFSRKQTLELIPTDLNDIIGGLAKSLPRLIREDVEFRMELADERLPVMADKWQLEQVIINLAVNARDAMPTGGMLSITTGETEIAGEEVGLNTIITPGRYGFIRVVDNGVGMDRKTQERIFEPFFTTKEVGRGTGLGLSMVYGAVKKHDGHITVYSEPDRGTTFKVYLPLLDSLPRTDPNVAGTTIIGGSETVLLVEDDATIRGMTKQLLENHGYHVLVAVDGEEAVAVFRDNRDVVQIILTDVIMPRKNGREALEEIAGIKSGVPAIFMSGYSADFMTSKGIVKEKINYLSKPLKPAHLLKMMRDVLAS